jgi:surface polysaccharide O-acyltransferase-like enzyme
MSIDTKPRKFYIDNLRIYLTILVILHHVAVAYGGSGGWPLKEAATDAISPILFLIFNALNQSYFMSFFFLLGGYFTPRSLEKKGMSGFLNGRLTRLGIPIIIYLLVIQPITYWFVLNIGLNINRSFAQLVGDILTFSGLQRIEFGHLWFLWALLIFAFAYVIVKGWFKEPIRIIEDSFPSNRTIALSMISISLVTFLIRLWIPVGVWMWGLEPARLVHYTFSFALGILAYRGKWFEHLTSEQAKLWGKVALVNVFILPVAIVLGSSGDGGLDAFMGGLTVQSMVYSVWESVAMLSIIIWLLGLFKNRFNTQGKVLRWMSSNVFMVYIIHQLVVVLVMIPLLQFAWPSTLKALIVAVVSVPLCFLVSDVLRKIPYMDRVL